MCALPADPRSRPTRRRRRQLATLLAAAAVATLLTSCPTHWHATFKPPQRYHQLDADAPFVKAHTKAGDVYVLQRWGIDRATRVLSGEGLHYDAARTLQKRGAFSISLDRLVLLETNKPKAVQVGGVVVLGVISAASAAVTVGCIASPKSCFGSCPTFYVFDGKHETLQAEGFSASVLPRLEETDVDALFAAKLRSRDVSLLMTNEAFETHAVRRVRLLAVQRPAGYARVLRGGALFYPARALVAPRSCSARPVGTAAGRARSCLAAVRRFDRRERASTTDGRDLAAREHIELKFPPQSSPRLGLVIAARNTLLNTFLFYQALAYMGTLAGDWISALQRADRRIIDLVRGIGGDIGPIRASLWDGRRWRAVGLVAETGPLAREVHMLVLPRRRPPGPLRLRLELTRGYWKIDQVAVAALGAPVTPSALDPTRVTDREGRDVPAARARLLDRRRYLLTYPRDAYRLHYRLPAGADLARTELFLESTGYYIEWMRKRWLADESRSKLLGLFTDPAAALRRLAPAYKRLEPKMERIFWRSRLGREGRR